MPAARCSLPSWFYLVPALLVAPAFAQVPAAARLQEGAAPADRYGVEYRPLLGPPAAEAAADGKGKSYRLIRPEQLRSGLVPAAELEQAIAPFLGHDLSAPELHAAASALVAVYLRHGWIARVDLVPVDGEQIELRVQELRFGRLLIDLPAGSRVGVDLAETFVGRRLVAGAPLPLAEVERGTALLNAQPGIAAAAALDPGGAADELDLVLRLRDRPLFSGQVAADNHGLREVGQGRLFAQVTAANGLGLGEQAGVSLWHRQFSRSERYSFSLPVGGDGLRAGVAARQSTYRAGHAAADLGLTGTIDSWRASLVWPWRLAAGRQTHGALAHVEAQLRDESLFGELSNRRIQHWNLALVDQEENFRATSRLAVELTVGEADLSANAGDYGNDTASARIHGHFSRLGWRWSYERRLEGGDVLVGRLSGQLADRNLDDWLKFTLGGPDGIRAYPVGEAIGDQGWLATLERRTALTERAHASLFVDAGEIMVNRRPWSAGRNRYGLAGVGAGLGFRLADTARLRLDVARQIGSNPARNANGGRDADGREHRWRLWLALSQSF